MTTPDHALLYCRFIDHVVNHQRMDRLDQFLAANVVEHASEVTVGLGPARQRLARWLVAFPDLHLVIEDLVVEGDHLMAWLMATGTHHGPLASLTPTGRRIRMPVFEAWSVPDGRCVERWLHVDGCALRCQLGLPLDGGVEGHRQPAAGGQSPAIAT